MKLELTDSTEILLKAKALIERDGWIQRSNRKTDAHGNCVGRCLLGALSDASIVDGSMLDAEYNAQIDGYFEAIQRLEALTPTRSDSLVEWNDVRRRTKAQVLDLLTMAANKMPAICARRVRRRLK